jgi:hypothetical protein
MRSTKTRRVVGLLILLISLALLIWGIWPIASEVRIVPVAPSEMQLPTPASWLPWMGWII